MNELIIASVHFRFLAFAVRSSSHCSCGTPQQKTAASGADFLVLPDFLFLRKRRQVAQLAVPHGGVARREPVLTLNLLFKKSCYKDTRKRHAVSN